MPGQAVVKVTKEDFFGPLVKNSVFNLVPDTTLASLRVNGKAVPADRPTVNAVLPAGATTIATVEATAADPAAVVAVEQATSIDGQAKVTNDRRRRVVGLHRQPRPERYRRRVRRIRARSQVDARAPGSRARARVAGAKNLALQSVNGDWTAESKLVFSRPLSTNNEQGGIIAYANDNNSVKLAWEMSASTQPVNRLRVVLLREQNSAATTLQVTGADAQRIVGAEGAIWLRLAKSGGTYKGYYSTDGVAFDSFRIASSGTPVPVIATAPGGAGGSVPATLSLTLGAPATFGAFTPGVAKDYTASTTAVVTSSAGDATLSVSDPGHLRNGSFELPSALQVSLSKSVWSGPTANEAVPIGFVQHIGAGDALRTGTYSTTLTFTLATTNP